MRVHNARRISFRSPGTGASDGSGRRVLNVYIDGSWGNPTNATIWNATNNAINNWNGATDPSCQGAPGSQTGYYLVLNQAGGPGSADIEIILDDAQHDCGATYSSLGSSPRAAPDVVHLRGAVGNLSTDQATVIIEHEFGHSLGLENCNTGPCAGTIASPMCVAARADNCVPNALNPIQPSDIGQSNRNLTSTNTCTVVDAPQKGVDNTSCPSDNGCSGQAPNGYPILNPDYCQYESGCPDAWYGQTEGGNPGAMCCWWASSPILIDVSGDGFELTDARNGVIFDLDESGTKHMFSWTAAGAANGWLALDRNGNGTIDSGAELFGNMTPQPPSRQPNGFSALAVYDLQENGGNGNGKIDPGDRIFSSLLVWIDSNHDGISQPNELHRLSDFGIESISLDYSLSKWTDQYGNVFRFKSRITFSHNPGDHWTYDVLLQRAQDR